MPDEKFDNIEEPYGSESEVPPETLAKIKDKIKKNEPGVKVIDVTCPGCGCDYLVPIMQMRFIVSFSGNRLQSYWPTRNGSNDEALIACAQCWDIIKIETSGKIHSLGKKLAAKE